MITQELITYIQQELSLGVTPELIRDKLVASGWGEEDIRQGIVAASNSPIGQNTTITADYKRANVEFTHLFIQSFNNLKGNIKNYLIVQFFGYIVILLLSLVQIFGFAYMLRLIPSVKELMYFITLIFNSFIFLMLNHLVIYVTIDENRTQNIKTYISYAVKNSFSLWIIYMIMGLALLSGGIVIYILVAIMTISLHFTPEFTSGIIIIGFIPAVIVGLLFMSWFLFTPYVYMVEKTNIRESLKRSKIYSYNHTFRLLLHIILISLALVITNIVPIVNIILDSFFVLPFISIYFYNLYKNFRMQANINNI